MLFLIALAAVEGYWEHTAWEHVGAANPSDSVVFSVLLRQQNVDQLKRHALAASTPNNPLYTKYLLQEEIDSLTAPASHSVSVVQAWLSTHGVTSQLQKDRIMVSTTASIACALLGTSFVTLRKDDKTLTRAHGDARLPHHVSPHVSTIFGLHGLPLPAAEPISSPVPLVTPAVIQTTYCARAIH